MKRVLVSVVLLFIFLGLKAAAEEGIQLEKILPVAKSYFVRVRFFFKKDSEATPEEWEENDVKEYVEDRKSKDVSGVIIDEGLVITKDEIVSDSTLDKIEVVTLDGKSYRASRYALLKDSPALILKVDGGKWDLPSFGSIEQDVGLRPGWISVALTEVEGTWEINVGAVRGNLSFVDNRPVTTFTTGTGDCSWAQRQPSLLLTRDGKPIGIALSSRVDMDQRNGLWKGEDLLSGKRVYYSDWEKFKELWHEKYSNLFHEVKIEFRQKKKERQGGMFFDFDIDLPGREKEQKEMEVCGLAVSPDTLFVPYALTQQEAKRIDSITIKIGEEVFAASFLGAFKAFNGFEIKLDNGSFNKFADLTKGKDLGLNKLLFTLKVEHKLGQKKLRIEHNRLHERQRGYGNRLGFVPARDLKPGTFLLDEAGNICGFYLTQRREGEEQKRVQTESDFGFSYRYYPRMDELHTAFSVAELATMIIYPEDSFDLNIVALSKEEEKMKLWMGVEFERMSEELAKQLRVEKATKDGKIGLLVNTVYPASPGSRLGIQAGDILLTIKEKDKDEPVELVAPKRFDFSFDYSDIDIPKEWKALGFKIPKKKPWRSRKNYLTRLLETIGKGKTVILTYYNEGEEKSNEITIEQAPRDFDSAEKYKNEKVGLTVKEVTYEVMKALQIQPEQQGVVVAKVETGSLAAVARVEPYEIITSVGGKEIKSIDDFKKGIELSEEETIQLVITSLGKSRIADIGIKDD